MSTKTSFQNYLIKYAAPNVNTNIPYQNGSLPITTLPAGRYLATITSAIKPVTGGANLVSSFHAISSGAPYGTVNSVGLLSKLNPAAGAADAVYRDSLSGVITLAVSTPIYFYLIATTNAGQWGQSLIAFDGNFSTISFVKIG